MTPAGLTPNQTNGEFDDFFKLKVNRRDARGSYLRTEDPDLRPPTPAKNVSRNGRKVRVSKIFPKPKHVGLKLPKSFKFVNDKKHGRHYELKLDVQGLAQGVLQPAHPDRRRPERVQRRDLDRQLR